jgi:hypothetical protein
MPSKPSTKYTAESLREVVAVSESISDVLRKVGLVAMGGNFSSIRRAIGRFGINTDHFKGQRWRGGKHTGPKKPLSWYLKKDTYVSSNYLRRRLIREWVKQEKCEMCCLTTWLGKPIALELEHCDGNHQNNELENLKILCPNCHAQTPTYRNKKR